jgi:hypothetical protein
MDQKTKHTPGPWIVHTFTISGKEKLEVLDATGTNACVQANAHLIAAAPAMYEALSRLRNVASTASNHMRLSGNEEEALLFDNDQRVVEAALAQAEGAQHE